MKPALIFALTALCSIPASACNEPCPEKKRESSRLCEQRGGKPGQRARRDRAQAKKAQAVAERAGPTKKDWAARPRREEEPRRKKAAALD